MTTLSIPAEHRAADRSIDRVWRALADNDCKPSKQGNRFTALCPVHGDTNASLSVSYDSAGEKTLLHCFSCNAAAADITAALGLEVGDLFDRPLERTTDQSRAPRKASKPRTKRTPLPPAHNTQPTKTTEDLEWKPVTTYHYTTVSGDVVQEVIREEAHDANGVRHKRFTQRFTNPATGNTVKRRPAGFTPVLYNAVALAQAIASGRDVWLVEGEKDADTAEAAGLIATTNAQGALNFAPELVAQLEGAIVQLVVDRDAAGYNRALNLTEQLAPHVASIAWWAPATTDPKSDLTDHFDAGYGAKDLIPLTLEDLKVLAHAAALEKLAVRLRECATEARTYAEHDDLAAAQRWAQEAEYRWTAATELHHAPQPSAELSGEGTAALKRIPDLLAEARKAGADAYAAADAAAPDAFLNPEPVVISLNAEGNGTIPPRRDDGWGSDNDDADNEGSVFRVRRGETVEVKRIRDGETFRNRYLRLLRGWADVEAVFVEDDGADTDTTRPIHSVRVKFSRWERDERGQYVMTDAGLHQLETAWVTWDTDQLNNGGWVQALPWPGMLEDSGRKGRDRTWDAIFNARPIPATRIVKHTATGWRTTDTGDFFVHGGGAIAKAGTLDNVEISLPSHLAGHYQMPAPTEEAAALRSAWVNGTLPLIKELPARIIAPLLGNVWHAPFAPVPMVCHLFGGRGSAKTSTARAAMHYFAPELHYQDKLKREILSGANSGGSSLGLLRSLAAADYLPVLVDDLAPDGDAKKARTKLADLARMVFNGITRTVGTVKGGTKSDKPIRATVITTGELNITGSGLTRMLSIPIDPGDITNPSAVFSSLERRESREARGLLGASYIQFLTTRRSEFVAALEQSSNTADGGSRRTYWMQRIGELPHDDGIKGRLTDAACAAHLGVSFMLSMMVDRGALTRDEADEFNRWAREGIFESLTLQESENSDPAEQLLGYLREAIGSGAAHLTTQDGETPPPGALGLGWSAKTTMAGGIPTDAYTPNGTALGAVTDTGRVLLLPSTAMAIAYRLAAQADETFSETKISVASSLRAHKWLIPDAQGKSAVGRRLHGQLQRVWDIPFDALFTNDDEAPAPDSPPPALPTLDEDGTAPNTPPAHPPLADLDFDPPATPAPVATDSAPETTPAAASASSRPEHPSTAAATSNGTTFAASLAVLDAGGQVVLPSGETYTLDEPIQHLGQLAELAHRLNLGTVSDQWTRGNGTLGETKEWGQIWVTEAAAVELGIPMNEIPEETYKRTEALKELTLEHPLITDARTNGWMIRSDYLTPTIRVRRDNSTGVIISLLPFLADDAHFLDDAPDAAAIARRGQRFADALRYPYVMSATSTGLNLLDLTRRKSRDGDQIFAPTPHIEPHDNRYDRDLHWTRKPTENEAGHEFVHGFDRGASYLAAVGSLSFGIGAAEHRTAPEFDKKLPGYWLITAPERNEWLAPNPLIPNPGNALPGEQLWVTTPRLRYAVELGYEPEIHEAWVWTQHKRFFEPWANRVRDARALLDTNDTDDKAARDVIKELYVRSFGIMDSTTFKTGKKHFAPERFHMIQDQASMNILRLINRIGNESGRWPLAIDKDLILYSSDVEDPATAWPGPADKLGRGLGQYKPEMTGRLDQIREFLTGEPFRGKPNMTYLK